MFLVGDMYIENMFNFSLDCIFMAIASRSFVILGIVY